VNATRGLVLVVEDSPTQALMLRHVLESGSEDSPLLNYGTRCPCGVHYCRITPEGKVTPCPYMPRVAGDLMKTPFRKIWESSPVFTELREGALGGRCGRCRYREVCGGCRARAYARTDDPLGPDDSCAYEPPGAEAEQVVEPPRSITYGAPALDGGEAGRIEPGRSTVSEEGKRAEDDEALPWSDEALERVQRIPSFVRGVVTARVERFARERGYERVDAEVMAEVRRNMPVDFSKRLPFFLRKEDGPDEA